MTIQDQLVGFARQQVGKPYKWGATGPNAYDCSGLVYAAYKAAGLPIVRLTAAQWGKVGTAVSEAQAQPGDLVYYDEKGSVDHVGIYVGGGKMIDAPTAGKKVEVVDVGSPTSFRHVDFSKQNVANALLNPTGDGVDLVKDTATAVKASWEDDALALALKVTAGLAVVALVVVGMKQTVSNS